MPNWCMNRAKFTNNKETIDKIAEAANGEGFFRTFVPAEKDVFLQTEAWGTKWDLNREDITIEYADDSTIDLSFDTAWCPPINFYEKFREKFGGEIQATFFEPGVDIIGEYNNGEVSDYSLSDELPESLEDAYAEALADIREYQKENENE